MLVNYQSPVIRQATFIPHPADSASHDARERQRAQPTRWEVAIRPDLTFFHAFAALSRNITEFTAVLGAPTVSTVQKVAS